MKILIVEDEHKIAGALKRGLEQEAYAVDLAYTGPDGLASALAVEYDALILDRMLPGLEGASICRALRKQNIHTPILMLTAKDTVADRVSGLDAGADDYLVKPFAFEELLARLRALLRRPPESAGAVLTLGDLELDPANRTVTRQDQNINLSSTEYALLEYLLRNQGKTVSKDQIISHVWDYDADILPNTVEAYIGYLRGKIERPFGDKPLIKTLRGFGYRLEAEPK